MRGRHISKPMEQIVLEAKNLVSNGVREIMLIAQDSTYYGIDIYKKRMFSELLNKLSEVEGLDWIRIHYAYPSGFPMDIIEVMKEKKNICNYLDIPLQHGSTRMLKIMKRGLLERRLTTLLEELEISILKLL